MMVSNENILNYQRKHVQHNAHEKKNKNTMVAHYIKTFHHVFKQKPRERKFVERWQNRRFLQSPPPTYRLRQQVYVKML